MITRAIFSGGLALLALTAAQFVTGAAQAQSKFPERGLRLVVPFAPGGVNDIIGRRWAQEISRALGQNMIVENRAGASGARSLLQNERRRERRQLRPQRGDFGSLAREFGGFVAEVSEEGRTMSVESRRVGPARFERRPTIRGLDNILVGRRGEAPLVPPYGF